MAVTRPAPAPPTGRTGYPVGEVAALLGVTPRQLQLLVSRGILPRPTRGLYDVVRCVQGYIRYLRGESGERVETRMRRETALAERAELDLARARGDLVEHARRWVATRTIELRGAWERWPERVAALVAADLAISDVDRVYRALETHVRAFLAEISKDGA